jgi:cytochrome b561
MHITVAIGAMLPLWWHCDLRRASVADLLLKDAAILLLTSGFLGVAITDLTRWRLLSPLFSPSLSAGLIRGLFIVHRGLALLTFILITIHVLAVLYFAGV